MKQYIFLLLASCLLLTHWANAQKPTIIKGWVTDDENNVVGNAKVSVNGSRFVITDSAGIFTVSFPFYIERPKEVNVIKEGMKVIDWKYDPMNAHIHISLHATPHTLNGRVINELNMPVEGVKVAMIGNEKYTEVRTNNKGGFTMELPRKIVVNNYAQFSIDGTKVKAEDIVFFNNFTFVSLKTHARYKAFATHVMVIDENMRPIENVRVMVQGKMYKTDQAGEFALLRGGANITINDQSEVKVEGYEVYKMDYVDIDKYLYLHIKTHGSDVMMRKLLDSTFSSYTNNFNVLFNQLELEKQLLTEKSAKIRQEIEIVASQLNRPDIGPSQRESTRAYLTRLERTLVETEVGLEDAHERTKHILVQMKLFINEKDSMHSATSEKLVEVQSDKEVAEQRFNRNLAIASLAIVALLGLAVVSYIIQKKLRKQQMDLIEKVQIINQKNDEMRIQSENLKEVNEEVSLKNEELEKQKSLIESKNLHITASINYAQRIQSSMLPSISRIQEVLPDSFVFFRPRDIVSGDFYWFSEQVIDGRTKAIIAAVDCTGHGVPGAFMSLVGDALLNQIIKLQHVGSPEMILSELNKGIRLALKQDQTTNRDGMDLALCVIDKETKTLEFAGAKNPLVYIQNNEIMEIKGNKISIGGTQFADHQFSKESIRFEEKTFCYIFSDGFHDQIGGEANQKFMKKNFFKLLHKIHRKPFPEQRDILEQTFLDWKQNKSQLDDILVVGFRLS